MILQRIQLISRRWLRFFKFFPTCEVNEWEQTKQVCCHWITGVLFVLDSSLVAQKLLSSMGASAFSLSVCSMCTPWHSCMLLHSQLCLPGYTITENLIKWKKKRCVQLFNYLMFPKNWLKITDYSLPGILQDSVK